MCQYSIVGLCQFTTVADSNAGLSIGCCLRDAGELVLLIPGVGGGVGRYWALTGFLGEVAVLVVAERISFIRCRSTCGGRCACAFKGERGDAIGLVVGGRNWGVSGDWVGV